MVSSASTTGKTSGFGDEQIDYFNRIAAMELTNPLIVGFGINDAESFKIATENTKGAIIGSAFIKMLTFDGLGGISGFVNSITG